MHFDPATRVLTLVMSSKIRLCDDFFSVDFIYVILLFSRIVWIDKLYDLIKGFFPNKGWYRNKKNTFSQLS